MRARTRILIAAGIGIAAAVRYFRKPRFDEDRPAIIVKGGSLIFQSGDDRIAQKGRAWRQVGEGRWTPHQPKGRPAVHMILSIDGDAGCKVVRQAVRVIKIQYVGTAGPEGFQITTANGSGPVPIPVVVGAGLSEGEESDYPTIQRSGPGNVFSLSYSTLAGESKRCDTSAATIEFFD